MSKLGGETSVNDALFLAALKALGRSWIEHEAYDAAFRATVPGASDENDFGSRRLVETIERLRAADAVQFRTDRKSTIQRGGVFLPSRLKASGERKAAQRPSVDIEWDSRLAPMIRGSSTDRIKTLALIDRWLKTNADADAKVVPVNTRSLHIFGDEKTLMALSSGTDRISPTLELSHLKCYVPHEAYLPHVLYKDAGSSNILIVENKQTYHSMKQRNSRELTYAAVGFGGGSAASYSVPAIADLAKRIDGDVFYFGDVDIPGFEIAMKLYDEAERLYPELEIKPAEALYRELLATGVPAIAKYATTYSAAKKWNGRVRDFTSRWLEGNFDEINQVIVNGQRIAQEWVH